MGFWNGTVGEESFASFEGTGTSASTNTRPCCAKASCYYSEMYANFCQGFKEALYHLQAFLLRSQGKYYIHWQFLCSCNLLDTLDLQTAQFDVILNHRGRVLQECFGVTKRPRDLGEEKNFHTSDSRI